MANRFWVGGSGTWDTFSTSNWSATSGGAPGASAPTSIDNVIYDAASGSPDVFISNAECLNWTHSAGNVVFFGGSSVNIHGGIAFSAGTTISGFISFNFVALSGSRTLNFAGKDLQGSNIDCGEFNVLSTATWTLGSNVVNISNVSIRSGTFSTSVSNFSITGTNFSANNNTTAPGATTVNLNGSTLGSSGSPFSSFSANASLNATLTVNLGTSTINVGTVNLFGNIDVATQRLVMTSSAGQSFVNNVSVAFGNFFTSTTGSSVALKAITNFSTVQINSEIGTLAVGAITFNGGSGSTLFINIGGAGTVSATSVSNAGTLNAGSSLGVFGGTFSCSGTVTFVAPSVGNPDRIEVFGGGISITGATTVDRIDCGNSISSSFGSISPIAATSDSSSHSYEFDGSANVTTGNIIARTLAHGGTANLTVGTVTSSSLFTTAELFASSSGTFVATSFLAGVSAPRWTIGASVASFTCGQINAYGVNITTSVGAISVTGTITLAADAFGSPNGLTINSATTGAFTAFTTTSTDLTGLVVNGGTNTFSGAITTSIIQVFSPGTLNLGTTTTVTNLLPFSNSFAIFVSGILNLNGTVSAQGIFVQSGTLGLGTSTTTLIAALFVDSVNATTTTGASSLVFNPPALTPFDFQHGGKTYHNITANGDFHTFGSTTYTSPLTFTCNNLTRTGSATVFSSLLLARTNITCNGTINLSGNSLVNRLFVFNGIDTEQSTITCASTRTLVNVDLRGINGAGGVLPWALGTSVGNAQNNANITFTPAVTRFATASGAWDSTAVWSASAGGATGATLPLPQDTVQFTSASPTVNLTTSTRRFLCNDLIISNYTGTITLNPDTISAGVVTICRILGDVSISSAATITSADSSELYMLKFGTGVFSTSTNINLSLVTACTTLCGLIINSGGTLLELIPFGTTSVASTSATINDITFAISLTAANTANTPSTNLIGSGLDLTGITQLTTNNIDISGLAVNGGSATVQFVPDGLSDQIRCGGSLFIISVVNTLTTFPAIQLNCTVNNLFTSTSSTAPFTIFGNLTLTGTAKFVVGTYKVPVLVGRTTASATDFTLTNNSTIAQETEYAYYRFSRVQGTNPVLKAFGATNIHNNTIITFPSALKIVAITNTGSYTLPNDFGGTFQAFAYGGGGQAGLTSSGINRGTGGGGGGALGISYAIGDVKRGQTVHAFVASAISTRTSVGSGTTGSDSWINLTTNSPPASASVGALGRGGGGSTNIGVSGGSGGSTFSSIGLLIRAGGNGGSTASSTTAGGGGGGGALLASYGTIFSTIGRTGGNGSTLGGGGGGAGNTNNGSNASSNGGAGGVPNGGTAGTTSVNGGNGGAGGGGGGGGGTKSGGAGGNAATWNFDYLNFVASFGTIGIGGGGGGAGHQLSSNTTIGGTGARGAGGGGCGRYSSGTTSRGGGTGGGLVVLVYAVGVEETSSQIIG